MNKDIDPESIHINSIPYELLGIIFNECEEYSFIAPFICKQWKETYKYLIQPEWNQKIQKSEGRKRRITENDKISLSFLKWANSQKTLTKKSMCRAVIHGDIDMMSWLWNRKVCVSNTDGSYSLNDYKEVVGEYFKTLTVDDLPIKKWSCAIAAKNGYLEVFKWLKEHDITYMCWDDHVHTYAAKYGHFKLLEWIQEQGVEFTDTWICAQAAKGNHLNILKWLRAQGCPWDVWTCAYAAKKGHVNILKWLRKQNAPWDWWTFNYAAKGGDVRTLKWLKKRNCLVNDYIGKYAIEGGHLEALKWIKEQGWLLFDRVCHYAVEYDQLEILKWLKSQGYSVKDDSLCSIALEHDHLEVFEWLKEQG
jgi:hypothetical protein